MRLICDISALVGFYNNLGCLFAWVRKGGRAKGSRMPFSDRFFAAVTLGALSLLSAGVSAQGIPTPNTNAQIDSAFQEVLRNPASTAAGETYARLLVANGNFEGGIAALERLLLDPAAPPTIRLELGVLYYRLSSYAMAEYYIRQAVGDPRLTGELRDTANTLLADLSRRNASGSLFSGSITLGLRGQSNPTAAANSDRLLSAGIPFTRPANQDKKSGADAFISADLLHEWDFQTQNSATLVTTGSLFANHYQNAADYNNDRPKTDPRDLVAASFTMGIRFKPAPIEMPNLTLRPYIAGSELLLDGYQYMAAAGGGLDVNYRVENGGLAFGATYDLRGTSFAKRADITESDKQGGYEQFLQLRVIKELTPLQALTADVTVRNRDTDRGYFTYWGTEARLTYNLNYTNPFGWDKRLWSNSLYGAYGQRDYDAPDPSVKPGTTRRDTEWRLGGTQVIPIIDRLSAIVSVEYLDNRSNITNYSYRNLKGWSGLIWNF